MFVYLNYFYLARLGLVTWNSLPSSANCGLHLSGSVHQDIHKKTQKSPIWLLVPLRTLSNWRSIMTNANVHYTCFPCVDVKLPACWQQVVVMEFGKRHNRQQLLPAPTCYGLVAYVADLLWTYYGETGVMDFGL